MKRYNTSIAPRVLDLCQKPLTVAEIEDQFSSTERHRAKFAVYNLVKRGQLRNVNPGQKGWNKCGRFVVTDTGAGGAPRGDGRELARAWGLMA